MQGRLIPNPVAAVVGDVIGSYYYSHTRLNTLYWEAGAPGEPPEANCVDKCTRWLKRANADPQIDALNVLGRILEEFMEIVPVTADEKLQWGRERIGKALKLYGLSYHQGGIIATSAGLATRSLADIIRERDLAALDVEFERALSTVGSDPPAGLTAACALLEALFKTYIEDEQLQPPKKQTVKPLWAVVQNDLGLSPGAHTDHDLKRILTGLTSVVDGLGALRTHAGSAHGRGRVRYSVEPRHARLAVHGAHTVAVFVLETWEKRRRGRGVR